MEITVTEHVIRIVAVAPKARVDIASAPQLQEQLDGLLAGGVTRIVLDLSDVPFMDSAGMAVLVRTLKNAHQHNGNVILVWPNDEAARRVLSLTKFDRIFIIKDTLAEAIAEF